MRKKVLFIALVIVLTLGVVIEKSLEKKEVYEEKVPVVKKETTLSMMLETEANSGEYTMQTRSSWPTKEDGYIFNQTLSMCENGSKLSWDEENNMVLMVGISSDKCYVYFDVYIPPLFLVNWVKGQYTGTQGENNIYYHNGTIKNGSTVIDAGDNSYRYAGANPNNFVCFGTDAEACPDDNLYRIIGAFGDQVKLIKWDYANSNLLGTDGDYDSSTFSTSNYASYRGSKTTLNEYSWNNANYDVAYNATGYYNDWSYSKLNTVNLNTNFIANIGSTWANKIATTTWKVGGGDQPYLFFESSSGKSAYKAEITNPSNQVSSSYGAKIGLMYVNDYYFSALSSYWLNPGYIVDGISEAEYDYRSAINDNWIYMGIYEFTITRETGNKGGVCDIEINGQIFTWSCDYTSPVRPVFYLKSSVAKVGDNIGSKNDPIRIE